MTTNNQIISKGIYNRPQTAGYVTVKQFIFTRTGEKKHLLLRFSNDLDVFIDGIAFTVLQINAEGTVIKSLHVKHKGRIDAGECFALDKAIVVDEQCVDVKVTVNAATSGAYEYSERSGIVTVRYKETVNKNKILSAESFISAQNKKAAKRERRRSRIMAAVATLAIISIIITNLLFFLMPVIEDALFDYKNKREQKVNESQFGDAELTDYDNLNDGAE